MPGTERTMISPVLSRLRDIQSPVQITVLSSYFLAMRCALLSYLAPTCSCYVRWPPLYATICDALYAMSGTDPSSATADAT
eukprot:1929615-Rhodomonas_salina.2